MFRTAKISSSVAEPEAAKTTLLNALGKFIAAEDRILLIEDTSEIQLEKPNLVPRLGSWIWGIPQETDSAAIWLPAGVWVGWGVSEAREAFVTSLAVVTRLGL
jgi:hypothetical protein